LKKAMAGLLAGLVCSVAGAVAADEAVSFKTLRLEGNGVRWKAAAGQTRVVTYAIVARAMSFDGARNCGRMTTLDPLLGSSKLEVAKVREEIAAAFAMWESVANISFREAAAADEANILIGAQAEPEGWAFANVFYDTTSRETVKPISRALVCLNPERRWKIGFDGDLRSYDLRYTIAHEIGHAIGLDHPSGGGQIMGYRYEETFRKLQPGDVAGAVLLYGRRAPDAAVAAAGSAPADRAPPVAAPPVAAGAERGGARAFAVPAK
jgi:hypothetical protein